MLEVDNGFERLQKIFNVLSAGNRRFSKVTASPNSSSNLRFSKQATEISVCGTRLLNWDTSFKDLTLSSSKSGKYLANSPKSNPLTTLAPSYILTLGKCDCLKNLSISYSPYDLLVSSIFIIPLIFSRFEALMLKVN
ncbi:hypothetical protein WICPIJ_009279 [Wickerhamomyces pijperi]|uniref:Uncharacterized protein n=1 Tax=Wickerhamomyces pijperi TaxID=599730 RepID=A0A9P8TED8_WICPI|nr:hypothetical protein WICPIJ_009279 [Wickerhamomyces pijperi]